MGAGRRLCDDPPERLTVMIPEGNRFERVRGSWFQRLVERCLASPVLGEVRTEYEIRTPAGEFVARVSLAVPEALLAIEAHSRRFHTGSKAEARDEERASAMGALGW